MEVLKTAALSAGLVAAFLAAFLVALYCLQSILRVARHWDTSRPIPEVISWRVGALQVTHAEARVAQKATATLEQHHERLERMDRMIGKLFVRVLELEGRTK